MWNSCIGDAGVFMDATSLHTFDGGKSLMQMQFGNVVSMQNSSLSPNCLASKDNTFPSACFFPQNTLPTQQTPTFVRNSFYNYGEWEVRLTSTCSLATHFSYKSEKSLCGAGAASELAQQPQL